MTMRKVKRNQSDAEYFVGPERESRASSSLAIRGRRGSSPKMIAKFSSLSWQ